MLGALPGIDPREKRERSLGSEVAMDPDQKPYEVSDYVVATYEEIRLRFGLGGTDQARIKAKRRKWPAEPRNHPGAIARIRVPRAEWNAAAAEIEGERSRGSDPSDPDQFRRFRILDGALTAFREERDRLLTERDAAVEQARALERRLEEERLQAIARLEEIRTGYEIARIEAARAEEKAEGLRLALEEARRPFWRRWIG
jgi:hypothetical protein